MTNSRQVNEGELLWQPTRERVDGARLTDYMRWLREERGVDHDSYDGLWRWSVDNLESFWASIWDYFGVIAHTPYRTVLAPSPTGTRVEGARWFEGATLNYAEHCLRRRDDHVAVIAAHESGSIKRTTFAELAEQVAAFAAGLRKLGVGRGDAVVGFLPNITEAVVASLAAASIGAAWSSCPPEFGTPSVIDRFQQVGPKVLVVADGYTYNGKRFDSLPAVGDIQRGLPSLEHTVVLPYVDDAPDLGSLTNAMLWADVPVAGAELVFEAVPPDHPLYIVYSSGTTGVPKAIVHGHGGVLLEHFKSMALHMDLGEEDCFFWFTTTGWMMWNFLVSGLLVGSTIVVYDGSPAHPDLYALWRVVEKAKITCMGISAPYILGGMKAGVNPSSEVDLSSLKTVGATGAPLPPEGFAWIYDNVGGDVLAASISGGTDMLTAMVAATPTLPIYAGEMQCRALGCKVESYDDAGHPLIDEVGELVITEPMPSMPVHFLNDPDRTRLHESYFDVYPDTWRHGDWLKVTERGTCVIYGRSDSTLNRSGVRMGTSEFYRVVEDLPEVLDSLVIDTSQLGNEGELLLFVVLANGGTLDGALRTKIAGAIRSALSPRHVPNAIQVIAEVPRTLNGKKLEVPVKKILNGVDPETAVSFDALANAASIEPFIAMAKQRNL
ncbi:MAG: acetoacetate--CoA ligase [Chloroflexi bacterium]|nr:acetoacetate--CoA ligase [Chloroflexota bacterium]